MQKPVPSRVLGIFLTLAGVAVLAALVLLLVVYLEVRPGMLTGGAAAVLAGGYVVIAALAIEGFRRFGLAPVSEQTAELEALLAQQREINRRQHDFLTHVHHEVRTPVTVVLGATQLLAAHGEELPVDEREQLRDAAYRNAQVLSVLVDDLTLGVDEALPGLASGERLDNWSSPRTNATPVTGSLRPDLPRVIHVDGVGRPAT